MATAMQYSNSFQEITAPSTSASRRVHFDVFINHLGLGTEYRLASSIYTTHQGMGLKVFRRRKAIEQGDFIPSEIEEAMRTSFLHISILTPNFAHSPWCLAELSYMQKNGKEVIPVFYGVERSDVRYSKGVFADAFAEYERKKRYTPEMLQDWKDALYNVSFHSGEILNGDEDEESVLKSIWNRLMEMDEVVRHPLVLGESVRDFERTIPESIMSHQNAQIVGIVGPGGSGKTTLAKELYTRKCPMMKRSSFLSHLGSSASEQALINLQKRLLGDLLPGSLVNDLPFCSIADGKIIVASHLRSVRVLIVLDDVGHVDQLDALLPEKENLPCGSLIIVTTRHSNILTSWGISSIYEMKRFDPLHGEQLLCRHAFPRSLPPDGFKLYVERFVRLCDGMPLTLKVLGGLLKGKSQEYWKSHLYNFLERLPINTKKMLKMNLFTLSEVEQEIFLDVACFFIGEEISLAIAVWEGLGWNGMHSWEMLVNKCLVELDEKKRIRMHNDLRDIGKEIAMSDFGIEIGARPFSYLSGWAYRIWSPEQIVNIQKGKIAIRGIMAATSQFVPCSAHEEFPTYSDYYQPPFKDYMELIEESRRPLKPPSPSSDSELLLPSRSLKPLCPSSDSELLPSCKSLEPLSPFSDSELDSSSRSLKPLIPSVHWLSSHIRRKVI